MRYDDVVICGIDQLTVRTRLVINVKTSSVNNNEPRSERKYILNNICYDL